MAKVGHSPTSHIHSFSTGMQVTDTTLNVEKRIYHKVALWPCLVVTYDSMIKKYNIFNDKGNCWFKQLFLNFFILNHFYNLYSCIILYSTKLMT